MSSDHALPDGSTAHVEPIGWCSSLISRRVNGETTWGQAFARTHDHDAQVADVLGRMRADPGAFVKWNAPPEKGTSP